MGSHETDLVFMSMQELENRLLCTTTLLSNTPKKHAFNVTRDLTSHYRTAMSTQHNIIHIRPTEYWLGTRLASSVEHTTTTSHPFPVFFRIFRSVVKAWIVTEHEHKLWLIECTYERRALWRTNAAETNVLFQYRSTAFFALKLPEHALAEPIPMHSTMYRA